MWLPHRIYLSPPHLGDAERRFVQEAFDTNWISPAGPNLDAFEKEFAAEVGAPFAVALTSGTAALHLALRLAGVGAGDEVLVSTLTFCASVNPILYENATPIFIDSERISWNLDPQLLEDAIKASAKKGKAPKALVAVHLYGQCADLEALADICERYNVALIEDAAESLGATYFGSTPSKNAVSRRAGNVGLAGIYSLNGNKIITTSGGGMLVTADEALARAAIHLATQARDEAPHYQHSEIGHNYRMSNVLAGIGRGQIRVLRDRVEARRHVFERYVAAFADLPGVTFMPEAPWGRSTRWLTCLTIDPAVAGTDREAVRLALEAMNIDARPIWKPMHLQPVFEEYAVFGGSVSEDLFEHGLCLPSGSGLTLEEQERVVDTVRAQFKG